MRRWAIGIGIVLLAVGIARPGSAARAQEALDMEEPPIPGVDEPAAAVKDDATDDASDDKSVKALIESAGRSFVVVRTWYQKDLTEPVAQSENDWRTATLYGEVDQKRPAEVPGVVLDGQGHVLIVDDGIEDRFIKNIEIELPDKTRLPGRREKLLLDAPGILLKVDAKDAAKLTPLTFAPLREDGVDTKLLQARLSEVDDRWHVRVGALPSSVLYGRKDGEVYFGAPGGREFSHRFTISTGPAIVADKDGRPVGCAVGAILDLAQKECLWKGPDLLKAQGLSWPEFRKTLEACRKDLVAATQEVVIMFHQGGNDEDRYPDSSSAQAGREISTYGMAISETRIFVPAPLDRKTAAQIDKLYVKFSPKDRQAAEFVGAFKDFSGFIVQVPKGRLKTWLKFSPENPAPMRPFLVASTRKKLGEKYVDLTTNRLTGKTRGYAGEYHWEPASEIAFGSVLVDFAGRVVGANLIQRMEHEEERQFQQGSRYYSPRQDARVFLVSEFRDALAAPDKHLDPKIVVKTRTESKRRSWLGVEFVAISPDLAEMMKVEAPTKDGQLGYIVNAVYAGSPAEKMGLKVGDILLKIAAPGLPYPIELSGRLVERDSFGRSRWFGMIGGGEGEEEGGPLPPTWKKRDNVLTRALDAVGIGKTVTVTYFRPGPDGQGKPATLEYRIEQAPPDFDSAPRWQNRKLGLTAKDITYEIAHALNLTSEAPGVLVAKVEPGSPVLVARIFPNEIVTRLNDKPLKSARQMRDLIAEARAAGKDKVRLTVLRLGKTRFADLVITAYDAADDEGIDEE